MPPGAAPPVVRGEPPVVTPPVRGPDVLGPEVVGPCDVVVDPGCAPDVPGLAVPPDAGLAELLAGLEGGGGEDFLSEANAGKQNVSRVTATAE